MTEQSKDIEQILLRERWLADQKKNRDRRFRDAKFLERGSVTSELIALVENDTEKFSEVILSISDPTEQKPVSLSMYWIAPKFEAPKSSRSLKGISVKPVENHAGLITGVAFRFDVHKKYVSTLAISDIRTGINEAISMACVMDLNSDMDPAAYETLTKGKKVIYRTK